MTESRLDLCAANKRTGFCAKCGVYVATDPETRERDCVEFSDELDSWDDDGNYVPHEADDPLDYYGE